MEDFIPRLAVPRSSLFGNRVGPRGNQVQREIGDRFPEGARRGHRNLPEDLHPAARIAQVFGPRRKEHAQERRRWTRGGRSWRWPQRPLLLPLRDRWRE